jgi:hypothetical protein
MRAQAMKLTSEYLVRCKSPADIRVLVAERLGMSKALTHQVLMGLIEEIEQGWRAKAVIDYDLHVQKEVAKLEAQEAELWAAWERSKEDITTQSIQTHGGPVSDKEKGGAQNKKTLQKRGQTGNSAYMQLILQVQQRRASLLGLDKPIKKAVTDTNGDDLPPPPPGQTVMPNVIVNIQAAPPLPIEE